MKKFKAIIVLAMMIASFANQATAQCNYSKVLNTKVFTLDQLETKWATYIKDAGFKTLLDEVTRQGYVRIAKNEKTAWGFDARFISDSVLGTSEQGAEVCTFDFYKKTATGGQMCSMVWRKVGATIYKSFILFPPGEKDFAGAMAKSTEYFVDEDNKIQLAHSFGKCWANCLFKRFSATNCASAMTVCGAAAAGLVAAGIGVTTPIALGIFGGCAGVFCLAPLAICAASCL